MTTRRSLMVGGLAVAAAVPHAVAAADARVIRLWPGVAPGSESWRHREVEERYDVPRGSGDFMTGYRNVVTPTLTVVAPARPNGTAIIVCPGGAFHGLAWQHEGLDVAAWLAARGVTAFVLKYRTKPLPEDPAGRAAAMRAFGEAARGGVRASARFLDAPRRIAIADGRQALKIVRGRADQWRIAAQRVGVIGFSAGASLTMGLVNDPGHRPDFAAPIYGFDVDEGPVARNAPPLFIVATQADKTVPAEESVRIFTRWNQAGASADLHVFSEGPHGFGAKRFGLPVDRWLELFEAWLGSRGLLSSAV